MVLSQLQHDIRSCRAWIGRAAAVGVLALDFPAASFNVVHTYQVLRHVADPVAALREMLRVCRPGGLVAARDGGYGGSSGIRRTGGSIGGTSCTTRPRGPMAASLMRGASCVGRSPRLAGLGRRARRLVQPAARRDPHPRLSPVPPARRPRRVIWPRVSGTCSTAPAGAVRRAF
jgi:SAM-dependent methyltransferase